MSYIVLKCATTKSLRHHAPNILSFCEIFHHFLHLEELLEKLVHFLHGSPAPRGDAFTPRTVDNRRMLPLFNRHRQDDGLNIFHLFLVNIVDVAQLVRSRNHRQHLAQRTHFFDFLKLAVKIFEREL